MSAGGPLSRGFAPVLGPGARVLILGSLPGRASLAAQRYYAQPRNAFWALMGDLFGAGPTLAYEARLKVLTGAGIALWDVCAAARRAGSLDAAIELATLELNPLGALLEGQRSIGRLVFNGQTAAALYTRRVLPGLSPRAAALPRLVLPSTSPAHASVSYAAKLAAWRAALGA